MIDKMKELFHNKKLLIIIGIIIVLIICGAIYYLFFCNDKEKRVEEKIIVAKEQIFNVQCEQPRKTAFLEKGEEIECLVGFETNKNPKEAISKITGTIDLGAGLNIKQIIASKKWQYKKTNNNFELTFKNGQTVIDEELLTFVITGTGDASSQNTYFKITKLIATAEKKHSYPELNIIEKNSIEVAKYGNIYAYQYKDKTNKITYFASNEVLNDDQENSYELIYEYSCLDKEKCSYDDNLIDTNNTILVNDKNKVFTYNIKTKEQKDYNLTGDIIRVSYLNINDYSEEEPVEEYISDEGILVEFKDKLYNFYAFATKKYLFSDNVAEVKLLNHKFVGGYLNYKCGIASIDGKKLIPFTYEATYVPRNEDDTEEPQYNKTINYEYNGKTYYILSKDMKFGLVDEDNNIIMPFEYDNLFYSSIIKRLYSNIYDDTKIFDERNHSAEDTSDFDDKDNFNKQFYLKQIDFYSLNNKFEKSITINNNARFFSFHVNIDECRNEKCYNMYDLNGINYFSESEKMHFCSTFADGDDIGDDIGSGLSEFEKVTWYYIDKNLNMSNNE